jgi:hypothetical protein
MSNSRPSLSDVLSWFALEATKPTAALVDKYRERYPEYADAIADLALQLAQDALMPEVPDLEPEVMIGAPSAAVIEGISHFQNLRYQAKKDIGIPDARELAGSDAAVASIVNPIKALSPQDFKRVVREADLSPAFVMKLRDRQIVPETIPISFTRGFATTLRVPTELLLAHLSAKPAQNTAGMYFKATEKPVLQPQETFEAAVRSSLSPEQQERLLKA